MSLIERDYNSSPDDDEADKWRHRQPQLSPDERSRLNNLLLAVAQGALQDDITDTSIDANRLAFARYLKLTGRINEGQIEETEEHAC